MNEDRVVGTATNLGGKAQEGLEEQAPLERRACAVEPVL
jgi:hypothetical protein